MRDYISPADYAETQRANAIIDAFYGTGHEQRADGYQNFLTKYGFKAFGWYRIVVGVLILVLLLSGQSLQMVD